MVQIPDTFVFCRQINHLYPSHVPTNVRTHNLQNIRVLRMEDGLFVVAKHAGHGRWKPLVSLSASATQTIFLLWQIVWSLGTTWAPVSHWRLISHSLKTDYTPLASYPYDNWWQVWICQEWWTMYESSDGLRRALLCGMNSKHSKIFVPHNLYTSEPQRIWIFEIFPQNMEVGQHWSRGILFSHLNQGKISFLGGVGLQLWFVRQGVFFS